MCCSQCCNAGDFGSHEFCSGPMHGICCGKPFEDDEERIAWRLVPREEPKYKDQELIKAQNAMNENKIAKVRREKEAEDKGQKAKKEKRKGKDEGGGN